MPFVPNYSDGEVERMIAAGGLSVFEVYRLKHQHTLNRLTHLIGIPTIATSIAYPLFAWFAWGFVAWKEWIVLSAIGWGLQFLGHAIEGNQPAFFQNPRYLIIGPLYFLRCTLLRLHARLTRRSLQSSDDQNTVPRAPIDR
jgi:uncharacterized membrane protein YGL010W